ncbi:MAG: hypothetical protein KBG48_33270 [Kofleriaceae bacterium]|nr:hypothetical protein [Kofleriaceae bacterium]MBP9172282.1 hypothetical protein [Kofleriaceae bacterium]MBP9860337.1 hypothetical protein [Kofleriaceae bacterium]
MPRRAEVLALAALPLAACATDAVPTAPSWQVDVLPVLAANCVRCHGYPTSGFATPGFRLDSYAPTTLANGDVIRGAGENATAIARRTKAAFRPPGELAMPPGRELPDDELAVLRNWAGLVDGALVAPRGPGRPDNAAPVLTWSEVARAGAIIHFTYELRDADRDLVVGSVIGPTLDEQGRPATGPVADLLSGRAAVSWDTSMLAPGSYPLTARLDDGADVDPDGDEDYVEVPLGEIVIGP